MCVLEVKYYCGTTYHTVVRKAESTLSTVQLYIQIQENFQYNISLSLKFSMCIDFSIWLHLVRCNKRKTIIFSVSQYLSNEFVLFTVAFIDRFPVATRCMEYAKFLICQRVWYENTVRRRHTLCKHSQTLK